MNEEESLSIAQRFKKAIKDRKCPECQSKIESIELIREYQLVDCYKSPGMMKKIPTGNYTLTIKWHCPKCKDREHSQEIRN